MSRSSKLRRWAKGLYTAHALAIAEVIGAGDIPGVTVVVSRAEQGAAWTDGDRVSLSRSWFAEHPDDVGGCLHEFTHVIMRAPVYDEATAWLIEGIADYVRDVLGFDAPWTRAHFEQGKALAGYQTTAHFLMWLEERFPGIIRTLSRRLSAGDYADDDFDALCGEPLVALVNRYEAAQRMGP